MISNYTQFELFFNHFYRESFNVTLTKTMKLNILIQEIY